MLRERLQGSGVWAIWFHAPGLLDENGADLGNCRELTGLALRSTRRRADIRVRTLDGHPLLEGVGAGTIYGMRAYEEERATLCTRYPNKRGVAPVVWCEDPGAAALGVMDGEGPRRVGLALKQGDGFTSLWSAAPALPSQILCNAARLAGAHVYCDSGDVIYAGRGLVAVHAVSAGNKRLVVPDGASVTDAWSGAPLGPAPEFDMAVGETRIFRLI
jgi:hypothetical protein